jgi:glycosyltransferase involved in cell wall biosynthesis
VRVVNVAYPFAPVTPSTSGGAEQIVAAIDDALVAAGHESIVIACEGSDVRGILVATPRSALDEASMRVARWHTREALARVRGADVVHYHGVDCAEYAIVPGLVTLHLPPSWYPPSLWMRGDLRFICVSESERGACPVACDVIPNGVDVETFTPEPEVGDHFVCLGRICAEKNFHTAVDAAKLAGVDLVIAGELFPYAEHQRYYERELAPRLDKRRRWIGSLPVPEKRDLLASARGLLAPSIVEETSSLVAMEALACGTPAIASRTGALPEIVTDGVTGFFADDPESMAAAIRRIGVIDRNRCRAEAVQRFDGRTMTKRYLARYASNLLSSRA